MAILKYKVENYQMVYTSLVNYKQYFMLFVDPSNDFKEARSVEEFAPAEETKKLLDIYENNLLFLSRKVQKKIKKVIEDGETLNNLGVAITNENNGFYGDAVPIESQKLIEEIEQCFEEIKKEML